MPRPKSKSELLHLADLNFRKLIDHINAIPEAERKRRFPSGMLNRNISDVICHLHEWHKMMFDWYATGMKGQKPDMPAKGYKWKDTAALNKRINAIYSDTKLPDAMILFEESHKQIVSLIDKHTNEELFTKKLYKWTGSTSLGAYFISASSSHYDWAYKLIKKALS